MSKQLLVHGGWESYYGTGVDSYTIISEDTWNRLQDIIKKDWGFYVHEWSGKHSEEYIEVSELGFSVVTDDPNEIAVIDKIFGYHVGNIDLVEYVMDRYSDYYDEEDDE